MSEADRERWDRRYADGEYFARTWPSELLSEWMTRLPRGRALDVACGAGRNALFLAENGYEVDAVDISEVALERGRREAEKRGVSINFMQADLEHGTLPVDEGRYDVITVVRYLERALVPAIVAALAPGGCLVYDHHIRSRLLVNGPKSENFRLAPNELLSLFGELRIVYYLEHLADDPDGRTMALAHLIACKGDPGF